MPQLYHLLRRPIVILYALALFASSTFAEGFHLILDGQEVYRSLKEKADEQGLPVGRWLMTTPQGIKVSPGLIVLGAAASHELESIQHFADFIYAREKLTLVLLSEWGGISVPAFDGLVLDQEGKIIANFSLKSSGSKIVQTHINSIRTAVDKIKKFSKIANWAEFLANAATRGPAGEPFHFHSPGTLSRFHHTWATVKNLVSFLAIESNRPNWVLVDKRNRHPLSVDNIRAIAESANPNFKVLLLSETQFITLENGTISVEDITSCERFLL